MARLCSLLVLAAAGHALAAPPREVQVFTDYDEHSLVIDETGNPQGCLLDVVAELMRRAGNRSPVQILPWSRALHLTRTTAYAALFPVTRTAEREAQFRWVGPLSFEVAGLYRRRGRQPQVSDLEAAKHLRAIAVTHSWYQHELLAGKGFRNLEVLTTQEQGIRMLLAGRVDLLAADSSTLLGSLRNIGHTMEELDLAFVFWRGSNYLAFAPQTPTAEVARWQAALERMKADGTMRALSARWEQSGRAPCGAAGTLFRARPP
ncbi:substrate-binding periplasmic protein [Massilia endophytica]|uniref:substrate-binding periplasmic protein n=1 Tax=Massilia endophytica TaxID=2899220 RepID=UPI001E62A59C|nr:transporter substrate-binding domain-containing protein [Massilia endophytica]UGQ47955.1 transporter substrate-binding domain-containing protein [Massilia endophytica]